MMKIQLRCDKKDKKRVVALFLCAFMCASSFVYAFTLPSVLSWHNIYPTNGNYALGFIASGDDPPIILTDGPGDF
mgnify:CR=1 FL=1